MPLWQLALIGLVAAWALQAVGTAIQMRHFGAAMREASRRWSDGFVGAANERSRFGAGVILLLVVSPDRIVRRALLMRGRTVFARFSPLAALEGRALDSLAAEQPFEDAVVGRALRKAIEQIQRAAERRSPIETSAA